jgi:hypothetical protein
VDQNPIRVNQTQSDKAPRKRCATVCEEIFSDSAFKAARSALTMRASSRSAGCSKSGSPASSYASVALRSAVVGSGAKLPERENTAFGMAFIGAASGSVEVGQ